MPGLLVLHLQLLYMECHVVTNSSCIMHALYMSFHIWKLLIVYRIVDEGVVFVSSGITLRFVLHLVYWLLRLNIRGSCICLRLADRLHTFRLAGCETLVECSTQSQCPMRKTVVGKRDL